MIIIKYKIRNHRSSQGKTLWKKAGSKFQKLSFGLNWRSVKVMEKKRKEEEDPVKVWLSKFQAQQKHMQSTVHPRKNKIIYPVSRLSH